MRAQPPKLIARAIKLRAAGWSYTDIASDCGLTKGVVAGILFRAGACPASPTRRSPHRKRPAAKPKPEVVVATRAPKSPPRLLPPGVLRPGLACSWPLWGDDTPWRERSYCGCATGGPGMSYCLSHWRMARRPAREMARV